MHVACTKEFENLLSFSVSGGSRFEASSPSLGPPYLTQHWPPDLQLRPACSLAIFPQTGAGLCGGAVSGRHAPAPRQSRACPRRLPTL